MAGPVYGQIKAGKGPLINSAAKYLVCGELRRRGVRAEPGLMNTGTIVIPGKKAPTVRVKAMAAATSWVWNVDRAGRIFRQLASDDFTVLVKLGDGTAPVEYFVVRTQQLQRALQRDFKEWLARPGVRGRPHDPGNPQRRLGWWKGYIGLPNESRAKWDKIIDRSLKK